MTQEQMMQDIVEMKSDIKELRSDVDDQKENYTCLRTGYPVRL